MSTTTVFAFEELGGDLPRPPLAAQRLFSRIGVYLTQRGWLQLGPRERLSLATEGAREVPDEPQARALLGLAPPREIRLRAANTWFESQPLPELVPTLGLRRGFDEREWQSLPGLHRFVLNSLTLNGRLLFRAYEEIRRRVTGGHLLPQAAFYGALASCEVELGPASEQRARLLQALASGSLLEGKGFVLARASGLRAARRVGELLDAHAENLVGALELEGHVQIEQGCVVWQAHASNWEGEFHASASLLAATVAATSFMDMIAADAPEASIARARIVVARWLSGAQDPEEATWYSVR